MPPRKISVYTRSASSHPLFVSHNSQSSVSKKSHSSSSRGHTRLLGFELGFGVGACVSVFVFILFLLVCVLKHKWKQNRASREYPQNSVKLRRFTYSELKTATRGFDIQHKLGQGGFGAVFKGILKGGQEIAVKKLDTASSQGEREFQNELSVIGHVCASPHIVRLMGFCSHGKRRLLVYEYMHNRSLQEALFDEDYPTQLYWARRFDIIVDVCRALTFLHACEPPIIHGDIKPSNVLLDAKFCANVADFGLARFKTGSGTDCDEDAEDVMYVKQGKLRGPRQGGDKGRKHVKDAPAVCSLDVDPALNHQQQELLPAESTVRQSVSSVFTTSPDSDASSSIIGKPLCDFSQDSNDGNAAQHDALPSDSDPAASSSPLPQLDTKGLHLGNKNSECTHAMNAVCKPMLNSVNPSVETYSKDAHLDVEQPGVSSGKEAESVGGAWKEKRRNAFSRDWWWRQESSGEFSVKDYVMDWMGHESRRDASTKEIVLMQELRSSNEACPNGSGQLRKTGRDRREHSRSSEMWGGSSQEEGAGQPVDDAVLHGDKKKKAEMGKSRDARHWWKEHNTLDVSSKSIDVKPKDSTRTSWKSASLEWWRDDAADHCGSMKRKKRSHQDRPKSREWWKDEEITSSREWKATKKKREHSLSREWSSELFSKVVSSTPSMRGTICYVAPENGSNGVVSEKSDVYSFGVLLLVIISGRRPLQVMASPITDFERANLISWARQLAHSGSVLDLVDPSLQGAFCQKQATLSITVALLCLQRLPSKRPSINEVLKMLLGEREAPSLPFQFSPSPPCRVRDRSRRRSLSSDRVTADMSVSS